MRRRKGTGSIEAPMPSGRRRVRIRTSAGRKSLGVVESTEAGEALLNAVRAELVAVEHANGLTLRAWGARVLDRREAEGGASVDTDRSRWATHVDKSTIADLPIGSITKGDVIEWISAVCAKRAADRRERRKLGRSTLQNILNLLRVALEDAVQRGLIRENPARGVRVPKRVSPTHEPWTYLLLEEQQRVATCGHIPDADKTIVLFAIGTMLRQGEQFNLRLADMRVDGPNPEIVVRYGSRRRGPKNIRGERAKIRRVPLFGLGLEAARRWLAILPLYCPKNPLGLVFPTKTGRPRQKGRHLHYTRRDHGGKPRPFDPLPDYLTAASIITEKRHDGMHVRWHDLRHTGAASLVSGWWGRRWSLEEVQRILGHESRTTTERYAHLADSALQAAATATTGPDLRPANGPRVLQDAGPFSSLNRGNHSESHLRGLNPGPTVYETETFTNNLHKLSPSEARVRAYAALRELGAGGHALAGALLVELLAAGHVGASAALAEVAAGRWGKAIELLEELLAGDAANAKRSGGAA